MKLIAKTCSEETAKVMCIAMARAGWSAHYEEKEDKTPYKYHVFLADGVVGK